MKEMQAEASCDFIAEALEVRDIPVASLRVPLTEKKLAPI